MSIELALLGKQLNVAMLSAGSTDAHGTTFSGLFVLLPCPQQQDGIPRETGVSASLGELFTDCRNNIAIRLRLAARSVDFLDHARERKGDGLLRNILRGKYHWRLPCGRILTYKLQQSIHLGFNFDRPSKPLPF